MVGKGERNDGRWGSKPGMEIGKGKKKGKGGLVVVVVVAFWFKGDCKLTNKGYTLRQTRVRTYR